MYTFITTILFFTHLSVDLCIQESRQTDFIIEEKQSYFNANSADVLESNFELVGGLILVEAELSGSTNQFILDTGSPHLFLNSNEPNSKKTAFYVNGIGGSKPAYRNKKLDFNWNGITLKRQESFSVDMDAIAQVKKHDFAGLIGYDQVRKHELVIDYKNKKVFLVSKSNQTFFENYEKEEKINFRMVGHIPVVKVKIGRRSYYFGIDTGAEVNVIDKRLKKRMLKGRYLQVEHREILGGGDQNFSVAATTLNELKVGRSYYQEMPFVFADLSFLTGKNGIVIDGLLGYPFLKEANFSINYRKRKLNKWVLKTEANGSMEIALSKKKLRITKSLFDHN